MQTEDEQKLSIYLPNEAKKGAFKHWHRKENLPYLSYKVLLNYVNRKDFELVTKEILICNMYGKQGPFAKTIYCALWINSLEKSVLAPYLSGTGVDGLQPDRKYAALKNCLDNIGIELSYDLPLKDKIDPSKGNSKENSAIKQTLINLATAQLDRSKFIENLKEKNKDLSSIEPLYSIKLIKSTP